MSLWVAIILGIVLLLKSSPKLILVSSLFGILVIGGADAFELTAIMKYFAVYTEYNLDSAGSGLSSYVFGQPLLPYGIVSRTLYAFITPFPDIFALFKDIGRLGLDFIWLFIYVGSIGVLLQLPLLAKRLVRFDWLVITFLILFLSVVLVTFTFRHILLYYPFMIAMIVDGYYSAKRSFRIYSYILMFVSIVVLSAGYLYLKIA
jgi:hypothetical protein